ncbi:hypothetical protein JKP88DRAFT_347881 [Tribonema minus]|uniref:Uncharacterized protein n=1 Tax=Tribonema minus TaxID=303371 RepID=A0A836CIJ6_9STRA|nr:hypothetical protein JKP88DRAFT_347881 [Tribonema minus]
MLQSLKLAFWNPPAAAPAAAIVEAAHLNGAAAAGTGAAAAAALYGAPPPPPPAAAKKPAGKKRTPEEEAARQRGEEAGAEGGGSGGAGIAAAAAAVAAAAAASASGEVTPPAELSPLHVGSVLHAPTRYSQKAEEEKARSKRNRMTQKAACITATARHGADVADANSALAQLQGLTAKAFATEGYTILPHHPRLQALARAILDAVPADMNPDVAPWEKVFNTVDGTRKQVKMEDVKRATSKYMPVKRLLVDELAPVVNDILLGLSGLEVVKPALLLSKRTARRDALAQQPHRDWPLKQLLAAIGNGQDGFPVGVLLSLQDGGQLHVWPGSHDTPKEQPIKLSDRVTIRLNAGDIVLFHGALVHAGAGYVGKPGTYHLRVHFYTQSAHGRSAWTIFNETEELQLIDEDQCRRTRR